MMSSGTIFGLVQYENRKTKKLLGINSRSLKDTVPNMVRQNLYYLH